MNIPKSYKGLRAQFNELPDATKSYLGKLDLLLADGNNFEVALAYTSMKLEEGHHRALKCGLVRIHKCHSATVDRILDEQHFTHDTFKRVFSNVFPYPIPNNAKMAHQEYTKVRNKLIHGKRYSANDLRVGIHNALKYIQALGEFVERHTNKNPYGDLRGLVARSALLPTNSTEWMLKGFMLTNGGVDAKKKNGKLSGD